ncbi:MAG TPA: 3-isopropylmalate dehydrogenase [Planctomycetota bacterium]|nr:3-isopropylmalate dehydrogenase [Planctomycetota bacterium]HRR80992.1 3-isopropylmalate dehydrogenase [Planctomycetota bacterium]HRT93650.1 3-isopropylmalate dehydrogenase [Planctomycetota bacterium]
MAYRIAVIPGDGTGPEVVAEGLKVLRAVAAARGIQYETVHYDLGGERYLRTGEVLPDSVLKELRSFDAIYLGALGHPKVPPGVLERGLLLTLRFELQQYVNLRPVKLYPGVDCPIKGKEPKDVDFVVVRENNEGLYTGAGGVLRKGTPEEVATQISVNTRAGVERCIRYAFEYTQRRGRQRTVRVEAADLVSVSPGAPGQMVEFVHRERGRMRATLVQRDATGAQFEVRGMLTLCGKTNVLTFEQDLWWRTFHEVGAADFPDVFRDYAHVDATCMWMVKNPEFFDVIVTNNMFGDIITDLGAMVQGGLGVAAGGNINPNGVSMFEPMGGSAPKYTGKNVINPIAAIGAVGMMLDTLGEHAAAAAVDAAIAATTPKMKSMAAGRMGFSTTEVGDLIAAAIA